MCVKFNNFFTFTRFQSVDKFLREKNRKWTDNSANTHSKKLSEQYDKKIGNQSLVSFNEFKLNVTDGILIHRDILLTAPLSDVSENLLTSLHSVQVTLTDISGCASTTLSSVATKLLALLNKLENNLGSLSKKRSSLSDTISGMFAPIKEAIESLNIGTSLTNAVANIETNFQKVIQVLDQAENSVSNVTKKFNDAVLLLATSVHVLIISIAVVGESAATKVGTMAVDGQEAVVALTLILHTTILVVQGSSSSIASVVSSLPETVTPTTSALNSFLVIVDRALPRAENIITSNSVTLSLPLVVSTIGVALSSLGFQLNESMDKLHISVVLEIPDKLQSIFVELIGEEAGFATSISNSTAKITSCISAISSSESGVQSKISRQLHPVFKGLLQLEGSNDEIVTTLISSLPTISDVLKLATSSLMSGVGAEVLGGLVKSIDGIVAALEKILHSVDKSNMNYMNMDDNTKECAQAVQVFSSIIDSTANTIYPEIDSLTAAPLEVLIALQILHSTVLYAVEWVTVVASSVFLAKDGKIHELLSSLAVVIVAILRHDSKTIEMIAGSVQTESASNVVRVIRSSITKLATVCAELNKLSGVNANTNITIEQIASSGDISVEDIVNTKTAEGNLSQILNNLIGSLGSISSTFSTSLDSLNGSLKKITSSKLRTIGGTLISVLTNLSEISGSATHIFSLTSDSLNSLFGHLLQTISTLPAIGDLLITFSASVAQISNALHSLIRAINDYRGTTYVLMDAIKEVAKKVQIVISSFSAITNAAAEAGSDVQDKVSEIVAALPYIVFTTMLIVQQVVGVAIPIVSATVGSITINQHELTLSISAVLEALISISAEVTILVSDGILSAIPNKIAESVSNLHNYASSSLSRISGVKANTQATLRLDNQQAS